MAGPFYVDGAVGDDANAGTSEGAGNAWATIQKAADTLVATETVYVKSSATYSEMVTETTTGPIYYVGYTSTTSDGGQVTIDGASTRAQCFVASGNAAVLKNFRCTGATGDGVNGNGQDARFENCRFDNNGAHATDGTTGWSFYKCTFDGNGQKGIDTVSSSHVFGCVFHGNGDSDITLGDSCGIAYCTLYDLNQSSLDAAILGSWTRGTYMLLHNVVDGDNASQSTGYEINGAPTSLTMHNNIAYDCLAGFNGPGAGYRGMQTHDFNAYCSCDTDKIDAESDQGANDVSITGDPFTDSASRDYTLDATNGADLINAGYDLSGASPGMDIGPHQSTDAGGGATSVNIDNSLVVGPWEAMGY